MSSLAAAAAVRPRSPRTSACRPGSRRGRRCCTSPSARPACRSCPASPSAWRAAAGANGYGPVAGSPAVREAAAGYFERRGLPTSADRILVAPGSKALLYALLTVLPGDVVLPRPSWVSYAAQAALAGKRVLDVPIAEQAGGVPDPDALRARARDRARQGLEPAILVLTLPDNPTGTVAPALARRGGVRRSRASTACSSSATRSTATSPTSPRRCSAPQRCCPRASSSPTG